MSHARAGSRAGSGRARLIRRRALLPAALLLAALSGCGSLVPLRTVLPPGAPVELELQDTPFFAQEDHQCGPAALATVLSAGGVPTLPEELVAEVYLPGRQGSLQQELLAALRRRERLAYVLTGDSTALLAETVAGRAVLVLQNLGVEAFPVWHYAVLVGFDADRGQVILRSGRLRRKTMSWQRFADSWQRAGGWAVTVLEPGTLPAQADQLSYLEACAGLEAAGKLAAAEAAYGAAVDRWPGNALAHLGRGNVQYAQGHLSAAVTSYREGIRLAPANAALRNNLAQALLDSGCPEAAQEEGGKALELARGSALEDEVRATLDAAETAVRGGVSAGSCRGPAAGGDPGQSLSSGHDPGVGASD